MYTAHSKKETTYKDCLSNPRSLLSRTTAVKAVFILDYLTYNFLFIFHFAMKNGTKKHPYVGHLCDRPYDE